MSRAYVIKFKNNELKKDPDLIINQLSYFKFCEIIKEEQLHVDPC